jgi:hypothetical protein
LVYEENDIENNVWVADTGATSHMINHDRGLFEAKEVIEQVIVGDATLLKINKSEKLDEW